MKSSIRHRWRASLWGLGIAAALMPPLAQSRECGCGDLPVMIQELAEHDFLARVFQTYADRMPGSILTHSDLQQAAQQQLNDAFYSTQAGSSAGTTSGAHAALGTDINDPNCPIVEYLYDSRGRALRDKDGKHRTRPVTEDKFKTTQCSARTKADFAHERAHAETCKKLVANGRTHLWDRVSFFAANDAEAYRAGAAVLRDEIKSLSGKCGWDSSSKNRLPNVQEAQALAKRAAKARPKKRRKK